MSTDRAPKIEQVSELDKYAVVQWDGSKWNVAASGISWEDASTICVKHNKQRYEDGEDLLWFIASVKFTIVG